MNLVSRAITLAVATASVLAFSVVPTNAEVGDSDGVSDQSVSRTNTDRTPTTTTSRRNVYCC